jgi:hypothetical protein
VEAERSSKDATAISICDVAIGIDWDSLNCVTHLRLPHRVTKGVGAVDPTLRASRSVQDNDRMANQFRLNTAWLVKR